MESSQPIQIVNDTKIHCQRSVFWSQRVWLDSPSDLVPQKELKGMIFCHMESSLKRLVTCLIDPSCHFSRNQKFDRIILEISVEEQFV